MVLISSWGLDPFLLNQLCHFQAYYHVASTLEQHTRVTDSSEHLSHACHCADLLPLLRTTCGSNFILGSWSYPTESAVPFQAFYCIASTSEQRKMNTKCYKTAPNTSHTCNILQTCYTYRIVKGQLWCSFHVNWWYLGPFIGIQVSNFTMIMLILL